ncbi:twin transmembrane helix small protein [Stappia stellulata]|uniref:twin transmembrane helix small protein n=1 Tax=Stappia stellulata TaxID=71235 RepID=UPI00048E2DD8|nr:twin transmembrane helix small protein [Stappia stellulata]
MTDVLRMLIPVAVGAVAVVLMMGLWNMMRGGSSSRSQSLMRWRVGLQFLAVVIVMALLYLTTSAP